MSTTPAESIKERQLKHLNSQFQQLQSNLSQLESLLKVTKTQADSIRELGLMHGSLFMSSNKVFYDQAFAKDEFGANANQMDIDQNEAEEDEEEVAYNASSSSFVMPDDE